MIIVTDQTCGGFAESGRIDAGPLSFEIVESQKSNVESPSATNHSSLVTRHSSLREAGTRHSSLGHGVPTTLWASSLDGEPLERSSRILLTHLTDVQGEGSRYADDQRKILLKWGKMPLIEVGAADVSLRLDGAAATHSSLVTRHSSLNGDATSSGITVYSLDTAGNRIAEVPAQLENGVLRFRVCTAGPSGGRIYYEIVRRPLAADAGSATAGGVDRKLESAAAQMR